MYGRILYHTLLCLFDDVNIDDGERTENTFNSAYGPHAALFVKCDVTKETDLRGMTSYLPSCDNYT